jgi:fimbrial isopeptide formation D2 family protein/uncharacterized repeat protein (TIGR01451 family)
MPLFDLSSALKSILQGKGYFGLLMPLARLRQRLLRRQRNAKGKASAQAEATPTPTVQAAHYKSANEQIQQLTLICRHYLGNISRACKPRNRHVLCFVAILIAIQIANPVLAANLDYGDAPTSLTSIDAALISTYTSASHQIGNGTYLGMSVDAETTNQPNVNANGDDNNGTPNDEDGVTFPIGGNTRVLTSGASNSLTIKASTSGFLNAWIDWNQDGDWNDSGEKIATNLNLNSGDNTLMVTVPLTAPHGVTYSRFRFSSTSGLNPTGTTTNNGEVEDYKVNIALPQITACNIGLLNGGFEEPNIPLTGTPNPSFLQDFAGNRVVSYKENDVPAWATIANSPTAAGSFDQRNAIELWKRNQTYIPTLQPFQGNQFAEINAYTLGRLYQDFILPAGAEVRWQVAHRGRGGNDTMGVYMGAADNETLQGSNNTSPSTEWRVYSGVYTVPGGQDVTRFALRAISGAGGDAAGNFVDDVRLTAKCPPLVKGYKSVELTNDVNSNGIINPGDTLTYSLYYTNTGSGPTAGFQINDRLPAGLTITATGASTVTIVQNASATKNSSYTGADAGAVSNLLNPGALLDVGGIIRVDIPVTVNPNTLTGTLSNQGSASSNDFVDPILTDNIDSTTTGLGLTIPTGSIPQQQNSSIEPTTIRVVNALTQANLLLVKRITAIANDRAKNPNDNTVLNTFVDDSTSNDNNLYWPSNYPIGAIDAGKVKSGDSIEYTIYFLNAGLRAAKSVKICDLITANQSFKYGSYGGVGKDIQIQIGTNTAQYLTAVDDELDRTQVYPPGATISNCNLPASNPNRSVVAIGVTGAVTTGIPALTVIPGSTAAGTPNDSYGLVRFKTIVE